MKTIKKLTLFISVCAALLLTAGCNKTDDGENTGNPDPIEEPKPNEKSIVGNWKLIGIVDAETGKLTELEPKDCEKCYTLTFNKDNTYTGSSVGNDLRGGYTINYDESIIKIPSVGGTKRGEFYDGALYVDILSSVQSFSLQKGELRLYYNEKKEYLSYKVRGNNMFEADDILRTIVPIQIANDYVSRTEALKQNIIITSQKGWNALLSDLGWEGQNLKVDVDVDFTKYQVIAVFDKVHMSGGWSIDITDITEYTDKITITYVNLKTGNIISVITQPFHIVKIPVSDKEIVFIDETTKSEGE